MVIDFLPWKLKNFIVKVYLWSKKYRFIGEGRTRVVFQKNGVVIKIPKKEVFQLENISEREAFAACRKAGGDEYANCRIFRFLNIDLLMMEYIDYNDYNSIRRNSPSWVWKIDCKQVGMDRKGNLKAFDYPDDPLYCNENRNQRSHDKIISMALN